MNTITTFTIDDNGTVFVRERDTDEDGNVTRNHRSSFAPGADLSAQSQEVQAAAAAAWTPEVIAAYIVSITPPPLTAEQLAAIAQQIADAEAKAAAKADSVVAYLRDHTPAEVEAYVQTNVTDLASAKALMKKFAVVLCVLAKRELR